MVPVGEARAVGGGVDAAGKAGDDDEAGVAEIARQPLGEFDAGGGGVARADDRDHRTGERGGIAAHRDQRRRVVDHLQPRRIVRLAERDEVRRRALRAALSSRSASARG